MSDTRPILSCAAQLLLVLGCAFPSSAQEHGPWLRLETPRAGELQPTRERFFSLRVEEGQLYRLEVRGTAGLQVELLDAQRKRILRNDLIEAGEEAGGARLLVDGPPGRRWVRLSANGPQPSTYRLTWNPYRPAPDDHADQAPFASDLRWGVPMSGVLERPCDEDWFRFDLAPAEDVQVELRAAPAGGPLRLERLDASGERLRDAITVAPGCTRRIFARSLAGGEQRLRVSGDSDDAGHAYSLTWGAARDDHGDVAARATPILVGERVEGDLETFSDQDVFKVELRHGCTYRVVYGGAFSIELRDPTGQLRHRGLYGLVRAFSPTLPGTWTLRVPPDYPGHYTVRVLELSLPR